MINNYERSTNMNRKYSEEEKRRLIERYNAGTESAASILKDTKIARSTFYGWLEQYTQNGLDENKLMFTPKNFRVLVNKAARLESIVDILKAVDCTANSLLKEKLAALEKLYGQYNVHVLCDALNVSRGTFYNHMRRNKRDNTWYAERREELKQQIQEIYDESQQRFGSGKITAVLHNREIAVSEEMVRRLMRDMGLISIRQEAKAFYEKESQKYKNHLNQQFDTNAPNEVWVSDVTYFRMKDKAYYICTIIDLFSRKAIACQVSKRNSTTLVKMTLKEAYETRSPGGKLIFHTDRGSNYRSKAVRDYLLPRGIIQSFSRAHMPYDNSVVESFFSTLKREELYRRKYRSEREFRAAVDEYIVFYNSERPHGKLQYKTPDQKELEYADNNKEIGQ